MSGTDQRHELLIPPPDDAEKVSRSTQRLRRAVGVGLAVFVIAGLLNVFGVRITTSNATAGPMEVAVEHAKVARAGLTAPLRIQVDRPDGFDGPVEVRVSSEYLARFDEHGLDPEPDSSTNDGDLVTWTYDQVDGTTFVVELDARIEPGVHWRFRGDVEVEVGGDLARVPLDTWVAP